MMDGKRCPRCGLLDCNIDDRPQEVRDAEMAAMRKRMDAWIKEHPVDDDVVAPPLDWSEDASPAPEKEGA